MSGRDHDSPPPQGGRGSNGASGEMKFTLVSPPPPLAGEGWGGGRTFTPRKMPIDPKIPGWKVQPRTRARARALRRDATDAERVIWNAIRAHRLNHAAFRRQTPIGPYIVDFVCHAAKLVIEVDGGQHFYPECAKREARREAYLKSKGFRILRFNNYEVMSNRLGVFEAIAAAIENTPSPPLPRLRGRESHRVARDTA